MKDIYRSKKYEWVKKEIDNYFGRIYRKYRRKLEEAKTPEDVEKTRVTPEDKPKAKEEIDKALENKVKKIDENPNLTPEQKEKAKENGKKEVEKDTPTPDNPTNPSEGDKDKPYTPSPEDKAKAKETVDKKLEEKIKNIDKDPSLTPEKKEKAKEEAKKEAEKVKKSIEGGKTTEWVDEKGNPIKPVTPGTYPAGSTPNYELVGTVTNPETGKVTHIFKPTTSHKPSTVWVDVNGKPLKPTAPGKEEAGSVPKYKLVETKINPETGDVIHVFDIEPVINKVTEWVDTEGKVICPTKPGTEEAGKVPNCELVGTVKDSETGNTLHVFKPKGSEKPGNPGNPGENSETPGTPGILGENPGTPNTPEKPMDSNSPAKPEGERSSVDAVKSQFKRLANAGNETTNTAAAGFGALIAGIAVAVRRRQKKDK